MENGYSERDIRFFLCPVFSVTFTKNKYRFLVEVLSLHGGKLMLKLRKLINNISVSQENKFPFKNTENHGF